MDDCRHLARLAIREDLARGMDLSTVSLIPTGANGHAKVVARIKGVVAGMRTVEIVLEEMESGLLWSPNTHDGQAINPGTHLGTISGPSRDLLTVERILLNFLGHLSGVATQTAKFVQAVSGTKARIYDTRKTTPAWRRLEKFAVRCGGGQNHRQGLFEAVMIKDNHLAFGIEADTDKRYTVSEAIQRAREFLEQTFGEAEAARRIVEIEVDSLQQFDAVLSSHPDIILLDNMVLEQLRQAVARRDETAPSVQLEASGGVNLATVRSIAETGVDRISIGALTHSAPNLDIGLDWKN